MAKLSLTLPAAAGSLVVAAVKGKWSAFHLEAEGRRQLLGHDDADVALAKLKAALVERSSGEKAPAWVWTLMEPHSSLYLARVAAGRIELEFRDAEERPLATLALSLADARDWVCGIDRLGAGAQRRPRQDSS